MLAYTVREHNKTSQTITLINIGNDTQTPRRGGVKNVVQADQKGFHKNNVQAEEELVTAARTKTKRGRGRRCRHKAGGKRYITEQQREKRDKKAQANKQNDRCHFCRFTAFPHLTQRKYTKQNLLLTTINIGVIPRYGLHCSGHMFICVLVIELLKRGTSGD